MCKTDFTLRSAPEFRPITHRRSHSRELQEVFQASSAESKRSPLLLVRNRQDGWMPGQVCIGYEHDWSV
jgi:hypothetical protein